MKALYVRGANTGIARRWRELREGTGMEAAFLWMLVRRDLFEMLFEDCYVLIRVKLFLRVDLDIHLTADLEI